MCLSTFNIFIELSYTVQQEFKRLSKALGYLTCYIFNLLKRVAHSAELLRSKMKCCNYVSRAVLSKQHRCHDEEQPQNLRFFLWTFKTFVILVSPLPRAHVVLQKTKGHHVMYSHWVNKESANKASGVFPPAKIISKDLISIMWWNIF